MYVYKYSILLKWNSRTYMLISTYLVLRNASVEYNVFTLIQVEFLLQLLLISSLNMCYYYNFLVLIIKDHITQNMIVLESLCIMQRGQH